jgi:hypothetical protein
MTIKPWSFLEFECSECLDPLLVRWIDVDKLTMEAERLAFQKKNPTDPFLILCDTCFAAGPTKN